MNGLLQTLLKLLENTRFPIQRYDGANRRDLLTRNIRGPGIRLAQRLSQLFLHHKPRVSSAHLDRHQRQGHETEFPRIHDSMVNSAPGGQGDYPTMMTLTMSTTSCRIVPRFWPDRAAMAVASVDNMFVNLPVEFSGRSKYPISCRVIFRRDWWRTRRTYRQKRSEMKNHFLGCITKRRGEQKHGKEFNDGDDEPPNG
jgi:hypothetical protein